MKAKQESEQSLNTDAQIDSKAGARKDPKVGKRRFTDSIALRGRALKSDRRVRGQDRRISTTTEYSGAPRRVNIDRRSSTDERRHSN